MKDNEHEFLVGLTELTKKTGIAIGGCGCCGSPYLSEVEIGPNDGYKIDSDDDFIQNIAWMSEADNKIYFEKYKSNIVGRNK